MKSYQQRHCNQVPTAVAQTSHHHIDAYGRYNQVPPTVARAQDALVHSPSQASVLVYAGLRTLTSVSIAVRSPSSVLTIRLALSAFSITNPWKSSAIRSGVKSTSGKGGPP